MKTRLLRIGASLVVAGALTGGPAFAQSLGELARKEAERRKAITTPVKVYSNANVRSEAKPATPPASSPAAAVPAPAPPPSPSGTPPAAAPGAPAAGQTPAQAADTAKPPAPDPKQEEASWRKRIQSERDALSRAQTFSDALQSRINALSNDFVSRDDPAVRTQISNDRQKAVAELDRVKQEIAQYTKSIAAIQEEARKAGVPAGWVR